MKKMLIAGIALVSLSFASCTKTTPTPAAPTIAGSWVGTYQINDALNIGSFLCTLDIFSDSTVILEGGGSNGQFWGGQGTWTLSADSVFTATISNMDVSQGSWVEQYTATFSKSAETLTNGTWRYLSGGTRTGTFTVKRVQ